MKIQNVKLIDDKLYLDDVSYSMELITNIKTFFESETVLNVFFWIQYDKNTKIKVTTKTKRKELVKKLQDYFRKDLLKIESME